LLGVVYETDRPAFVPVDPKVRGLLNALKGALGDSFVTIADSRSDENVFLVHTFSDVDPGTYYLLDASKASLKLIGRAYPDLDPKTLPRMQSISFPATDGTTIPGYLTLPTGRHAEHLPLIVMPHGGPGARDHWEFDPLRLFLASRGYAVLQVNFRGSSGFGSKWMMDAHQDWGGLSYSDITDGARWAVHQGIADPAHMCIVGWSYGGYAALLGAVRNSDLYRCVVSIAGVSDLSLLESQASNFVNGAIVREQIGTLRQKLKDDSPQRHADSVNMPVLLIHGDMDAQSNVEQSVAMDRELAHAHKKHELVVIKDGWHALSLEAERTKLLTTIERFLAENLGPGAQAGN
jgi:dipeptidyl aminopeptidase/acylaminoacyl peptidase